MYSVKHPFSGPVKRSLLPVLVIDPDNQGMLDAKARGQRIREAIDASGIPRPSIAEQFGITLQAINGWQSTGRISKDNLARLARMLGKPMEHFVEEDEAFTPPVGALRPIVEWETEDDLDPAQHVVLPRLEMWLSAGSGNGMRVLEEPPHYPVGQAFRADFVRRKGWSPRTHYSMAVKGASMEPTIPDGASVVIDISDRTVRSGMIYAVRIDASSEPILKRLHKLPGGTLRVESDNRSPQFATFEVRPDESEGFEVIGRAVNMTSDL